MKKILFSLLLLIGLLAPVVAVPAVASAVDVAPICSQSASGTEACKEISGVGKTNPAISIIKIALELISLIAGFGAVVMVVLGGIKLTTANGDPASIKNGRDMILYSMIGVVVVAFSQTVVAFVLDKIG